MIFEIIIIGLLVWILWAILHLPEIEQRSKERAAAAAEDREARREAKRREEGMKARVLAGEKALRIHSELIAQAKRLCASEGLACDQYGCPEPWRAWLFDKSAESKIKFEKAKRVAEAYRPILLKTLRDAVGEELMVKLGEPEEFMFPICGSGHDGVLAYCRVEFNDVDKSLFEGVPLPENPERNSRILGIIPKDRNIEVSLAATFGTLDPGHGEQYIPGDLLVSVGVKTVDDVTSYYSRWRQQINPHSRDFLGEIGKFGTVSSIDYSLAEAKERKFKTMYSIEDPAEREKRIKAKVAKANAEGRELPLEGTQEDVSAAMSQAFQKMSPEQKKILRNGLL